MKTPPLKLPPRATQVFPDPSRIESDSSPAASDPGPQVAVSTVAVVAWLPLSWLHAAGGKCQDPGVGAKERTRTTLRLLSGLTGDFGLLLPVVGVIGPDTAAPPTSEFQALLNTARHWTTEQDWHRGEFTVFVESTFEAVQARWEDVLSPTLPKVAPPKDQSRDVQIQELAGQIELASKSRPGHDRKRPDVQALASSWIETIEAEDNPERRHRIAKEALNTWLLGEQVAGEQNHARGQTSAIEYPTPENGSENGRPKVAIHRLLDVDIQNIRGWVRPPHAVPSGSSSNRLVTDADIVIINAPNGRGKSSLIHAIALALTGRAPPDDVGALSFRQTQSGARERASEGSVHLRYRPGVDAPSRALTFNLSRETKDHWIWKSQNGQNAFDRHDGLSDGVHPDPHRADEWWWPGTRMRRMLQYRLTAYFPEHVRDQFDHVQRRATLITHFSPQLEAFRLLRGAASELETDGHVDHAIARLSDAADGLSDREVSSRHGRMLEFIDVLENQIIGALSVLPLQQLVKDEVTHVHDTLKALKDASDPGGCAQQASQDKAAPPLPDLFRLIRAIPRPDESVALALGTPATIRREIRTLKQEIDANQAEARRIEDQLGKGELDHWARLLNGTDLGRIDLTAAPLLVQLLRNLQTLRAAVPLDRPQDGDAQRLLDELTLVIPEAQLRDIEVISNQLFDRLRERLSTLQRLRIRGRDLQAQVDDLTRHLEESDQALALREIWQALVPWDPSRSGADGGHLWRSLLRAWNQWSSLAFDPNRTLNEGRHRAQADWLKKHGATALKAIAQTFEPDDAALVDEIKQSVQRVLGRFEVAAGNQIAPSSAQVLSENDGNELHRYRDISLANGVIHEAEFSTGMRTQVAIAELVGQKLVALSETLPEELRVPNRVILLDDVSSSYDLTNLVRESLLWRQLAFHPDPKQRLQIFIGTHHETMTNRLYDLLTPPQGCRVIVHQITDWSVEKGPTVESFELAACDTPNWADLAATLHQELS